MGKVSRGQLAHAVAGLIDKNQSDMPKVLAKSLAVYLVQEGRTKELEPLLRDVARLRFENSGLLEIDTTAAHALNDEIRAEIKRLLPAKQHVLHESLQPGVIGGVLLETTDQQLDLTVTRRLSQLKQGVL